MRPAYRAARWAGSGPSRTIAIHESGACVGEMSLLTGDPRGATVVALTEIEAMEIEKEAFGAHVRAHPEILAQLSELLARRQRDGVPLDEGNWNELIKLATQLQVAVPAGVV